MPHPTATKLRAIETELNTQLYERKTEINMALLAILAKQHILMVGTPGIAKSSLMRLVSSRIVGSRQKHLQMSKNMPPEAFFGMWDVTEFPKGRMIRKTDNSILPCHFVSLDEIWKTNGAVLNDLLTFVNERVYENDDQTIQCPLITVLAASNEFAPVELEAMNDRFLVRLVVGGIESDANFRDFLIKPLPQVDTPTTVTLEELQFAIDKEVPEVAVPTAIADRMTRLRLELREETHADPSPRRWAASTRLMQARAFFYGRDTVNEEDIDVLQHTLWEVPEHRERVQDIVLSATGESRKLVITYTRMLDDLDQTLAELAAIPFDERSKPGKDVTAKLRTITQELGEHIETARRNGTAVDSFDDLLARCKATRDRASVVLFD